MNILMLTSEFSPATGGVGTYAREMARAATKLGADVTVVAPDYFKTDLEDRNYPFVVRRFSGSLHSMRDMPAKIGLARKAVRAGDYDIVHAADWPFYIPLALARRRTRGRLMMTVHGTEINEAQTRAKRLAIRLSGVFGGRTEVVANSAFTLDLLLSKFPVSQCHVRAIPLGVSEFWFGPRADRRQMRDELGIGHEKIVMVTVARLTRRKGHLATMLALAELPESLRKRLVWLVIGPNGEADYIEQLRSAISTSDCDIRFLGALPDARIRDIYGAADFFCLTGMKESCGRVEGFGLVYLEAAACGLPSVATAIGGVPEAVIANRTGILVEPVPDDIAGAIAFMASDDALRLALGQEAHLHARALSWDRCAAETYGLPRRRETTLSLVKSDMADHPPAQWREPEIRSLRR